MAPGLSAVTLILSGASLTYYAISDGSGGYIGGLLSSFICYFTSEESDDSSTFSSQSEVISIYSAYLYNGSVSKAGESTFSGYISFKPAGYSISGDSQVP